MTGDITGKQSSHQSLYHHLTDLLRRGALPASMLFTGKKGVGKWKVATDLAKAITCLEATDGFCGKCASCRQADLFGHPDIFFLIPLPKPDKGRADRIIENESYYPYLRQKQQFPYSDASDDVKSLISIDYIRDFQHRLALRPELSKRKVGIIYEAERMLPGAMDSLLKTLEEPPSNAHLIIITDRPNILTPTILSRLRRINFPNLDLQTITDYIRAHSEVDEKEAAIYAHFTGGTLYNIEKLIDREFFELREEAMQIFADAVRTDAADLEVKYADSGSLSGRDRVESLIVHWQNLLRDLMILRALGQSNESESQLVNIDFGESYRDLLGNFASISDFERANERIENVKMELRRNVNPKMAAFSFLFSLNRRWKGEEVAGI